MTALVVTYRVRPEVADQNEALVEAVFEQLRASSPTGIAYTCVRADDHTFIHVAEITAAENPLLSLDAFAHFGATVAERCEPGCEPVARPARIIGSYRADG